MQERGQTVRFLMPLHDQKKFEQRIFHGTVKFNNWYGHFCRAKTTNKELQSQQNELEAKAIPDWNQ